MESDTRSGEGSDEESTSELTSHFSWSSLPEELVHHVLRRLPLESVMKFRCVCKEWNELLMSSSFSHSLHHKPGKLIPLYLEERCITLYNSRTQTWVSHDLRVSLAQVPFLEDEDKSFLDMVASGGGLLSFMSRGLTELEYLIYNPLTEQLQRLPPIDEVWEYESTLGLTLADVVMLKYMFYGIHVDLETGYYTFVIVDPGSLDHESKTIIYDSRLRSWKVGRKVPSWIIQLDSYSPLQVNFSVGCKRQCVMSKEKLHWMVEHVDGSDSVFIYDIKLDRWGYVKCSIPNDPVVFVRLLEHQDEILLVGKRGPRMALEPFCYFEIVELSGSNSTFVQDEYRKLHLRQRSTNFDMVSMQIAGSGRISGSPSWCLGLGKEIYFLLESRTIVANPSGGRAVRFTSPMMHYSGIDNSWTSLTHWKIREEGSGVLKPYASYRVWAFQPSLIHP